MRPALIQKFVSERLERDEDVGVDEVVAAECRLEAKDRAAFPEHFMPMADQPSANAWLNARARGDEDSISGAIRELSTIWPQ